MHKRIISLLLFIVLIISGCASGTDSSNGNSSDVSDNIWDNSLETSKDNEIQSENNSSADNSQSEIDEILSSMTTKEKIGQMIMLSIRSWEDKPISTTIPSGVEKMISKYSIGNIILFAENFTTVEDTVKLTHSLQNALDSDIPMFISVDQEGGNVVRLSNGCSLPGNMALGAIGTEEAAYKAGVITGEQLGALGVNMNLSPTLDVNNNPSNPVINIRSFSENPELVAKLGVSMIKGINSGNVASCLKHFPGHGDTETDSHYGLPSINKSLEEIKNMELIPFAAAINNDVDAIMTAHIQFPQIETEKVNGLVLPATLSKKIITNLLKEEMGFDGIVITDSMHMEAIVSYFSPKDAAIMAINAGVDILLMPANVLSAYDYDKLSEIIDGIYGAVNKGEISKERIDDAVRRILTVKLKRNLWEYEKLSLDEKIEKALTVVGNAEAKKTERDLAAKAVTVLENKTENMFADLVNGKTLFCVPSRSIKNNVEFAVERLKSEGKLNISYDINVYSGRNGEKNPSLSGYDSVIILTDTSSTWETETPLGIYQKSMQKNIKTAVISCRLPYDAVLFKDATCLMACYCPKGDAPQTETSTFGVNIPGAIEVLFGISKGEGKLPVTLYDVTPKGIINKNTVVYPYGYNYKSE
jgi:beta-N-acetylhexosaminidase